MSTAEDLERKAGEALGVWSLPPLVLDPEDEWEGRVPPTVPDMNIRLRLNVDRSMVGKAFRPPGYRRPLLLHAPTGGTQPHRNLASPGGVDRVLLDWMWNTGGIAWFYHFDTETKLCLAAPVAKIVRQGVPQVSGGRDRLFLAWTGWHACWGLPFDVPYVTDILDLWTKPPH
jgi:hypothetical protein